MMKRVATCFLACAALALTGCGYKQAPVHRRTGEGRLGRGGQPVPAARRPDPEPGQHGEGLRAAGAAGADRRHRGARQGHLDPGDAEMVDNPQAFQQFVQAQREVTGALSRLLAVVENYPQLKSDQNFRELQAQLEGTENRIAVARQRFIKATQEYNTLVRQFPTNLTAMLFGFKRSRSSPSRTRKRSPSRQRSISARPAKSERSLPPDKGGSEPASGGFSVSGDQNPPFAFGSRPLVRGRRSFSFSRFSTLIAWRQTSRRSRRASRPHQLR